MITVSDTPDLIVVSDARGCGCEVGAGEESREGHGEEDRHLLKLAPHDDSCVYAISAVW